MRRWIVPLASLVAAAIALGTLVGAANAAAEASAAP